jgi:hypothetical protein
MVTDRSFINSASLKWACRPHFKTVVAVMQRTPSPHHPLQELQEVAGSPLIGSIELGSKVFVHLLEVPDQRLAEGPVKCTVLDAKAQVSLLPGSLLEGKQQH